jgi:uncharacterized protein
MNQTYPIVPTGAGQASSGRLREIDALRGFALLGVVLSNAAYFGGPAGFLPEIHPRADYAAAWLLGTLVTGKFFLIFSFLFGYGMSVLTARAEAGTPAKQRLYRRLAALALLGTAHAVFLFYGDILVLYAILGTLVWFVRGLENRTLLKIAAGFAVAGVITQTVVTGMYGAYEKLPEGIAPVTPGAGYLGGFGDAVFQRVRELPVALTTLALFNAPLAWAAIVLGFVAGRSGVFPVAQPWLARWGKAARRALIGGATLSVLATGLGLHAYYREEGLGAWGLLAWFLANAVAPVLSFGLAIAFWRWAAARPDSPVVTAFARVGEVSLSAYLLHSVLLGAVFLGWGFGRFGAWGTAAVLSSGVATFVAILVLCNLRPPTWRSGPAEALLALLVKGGGAK